VALTDPIVQIGSTCYQYNVLYIDIKHEDV